MTPGVIDSEMAYTVPTGGTASLSGSAEAAEGSNYTFAVNVENMGVVVSANAVMNGKAYPLTYADGVFLGQIEAADFAGLASFEVSAELSDGVNNVQTNTIQVSVVSSDPTPVEKELSSPIQITEIIPNTANEGTGSDVFEYFELYNSSTMNVYLDNYHFLYDNGSSVTEWKLNEEGSVLGAGETAVVWVRNDAVIGNDYTADNFRTQYGIGEDVQVLSVNSGGFSNSGTRRMSLATATDETLYTVEYTAGNSSDGSIGEGESITFVYDGDVITTAYDGSGTPGVVADGSVIGSYIIPSVVESPSVTVHAPEEITSDSAWTAEITDSNLGKILSAVMTITAGETTLTKEMTVVNGVITGTVDYDEVKDVERFFYNIRVTDGVNTASVGGGADVGTAVQVDQSKAPALVITEIMPDTDNVEGSDAYEFIELYNNSNRDIDLKDYKLYYNYPDNGDDSDVIWWQTNKSKVLKSGDTLVFWVKNGANDALTPGDFNNQFGTSLDSEHLIEISSAGMANGSARGLKIATNVKDVIDYVTYNMDGKDNTSSSTSIRYQNTYQNGAFTTSLVSDDETPNPGMVTDAEKPAYQAELPESASAPAVTDHTENSFNNELETFAFTVEATSPESTIKTVRLFLKDNNAAEYEVFNLLRSNGDFFTKELAGVDLLNKRFFTYCFEISDGYNTVTTPETTIENSDAPSVGDRVNVTDGQYAKGELTLIGTGDNLVIDGKDYTSEATKSVFEDATIAFDASQTDVFFKNAVACGNDVIGVFNEGTYAEWRTYTYPVDEKYINSETGQITLAFHAGNKANNLEHNVENNDDFVLKNIRLVLPDGVTLKPVSYKSIAGIGAVDHNENNWKPGIENAVEMNGVTSETEINMGDGTTKTEILYVTFRAAPESLDALRYVLDTTQLVDGAHTVTSGSASAAFIVDNTAPVITSTVEDGAAYFELPVNVTVSDAIAPDGVNQEIYLDGEAITLPYTVSYEQDGAGEHVLTVRAMDAAGNEQVQSWNFSINEVDAEVTGLQPGDGTIVSADPTLSVTAADPNGLDMNVRFLAGERLTLDDGITSTTGTANTSGTTNAVSGSPTEGDGFPYEVFEITVPDNIGNATSIEAVWSGTSNNTKTKMYVYNTVTNSYEETEAEQGVDGEQMTLVADIDLADHVIDGKVRVMVQNGEGYTPTQYAEGETGENATYNEKDTPRDQYDFTLAVESDTQYYNEDYDGNPSQDVDGSYQYQLDIHNWVLNNRERMNIQYMFHDGDIIDDEPLIPEWENADNAYKMLDEAGMPYGVLAGNHDVGHLSGDYTNFSKYFGAWRYENNPWYGESYKDNRGHYDLITVDGIDFIMVYMGWGVGDEEIAWMNEVLAQYPERKAILNFHEYLLASGGLGEEPQRIHDEVVAANPNVVMVLSGHYHNAQKITESFDDNGDGVTDRTVYQMLFDYQGLAQGGMGYMRLMHFDNDRKEITIRTYSPSLDDYNAKDETDIGDVGGINGEEEFTIPYDALGITRSTKTLITNSFMANVYGDKEIGSVNGVKSGETASLTMTNAANGTYGWYAEITNSNGGLTRSDVSYVVVDKKETAPVITLPSVENNRLVLNEVFDPMEGVSAMDYTGKDITSKVKVTAAAANGAARAVLDPASISSAVGTYTLTYSVTDDYGNSNTAVRTVTVYASETTDPNQPGGGSGTADQPSASTDEKKDVETGIYDNPAGSLFTAVGALCAAAIILKKKKEEEEN